jgi:hypothetical protein
LPSAPIMPNAASTPAGTPAPAPNASTCSTPSPGAGFVCQGGVWVSR